jgi:hypothetical protein
MYPLSYLVGDTRWIQAFLLAYIIFSVSYYRNVLYKLKPYIYFGILLNVIFICLQIDASLSSETSSLLQWWYKDVSSTHKYSLGFSYGRFSGATGHPARLGVFSAVSIMYLLVTYSKKNDIIYIVISLSTLIASGSRTSMGASIIVLVGYVIMSNSSSARLILYALLVSSIAIPILYEYNIGRLNSKRYERVFEIISGEKSYQEVAGRGDKWNMAFDRRNSNYIIFGTLANPSYVYSDLTIDSGMVHIFTRMGPFGLLAFLFSFSACLVSRTYYTPRNVYLFSLFSFVIIGVMSINANTVTGTNIKNLYMFSVFLLR